MNKLEFFKLNVDIFFGLTMLKSVKHKNIILVNKDNTND